MSLSRISVKHTDWLGNFGLAGMEPQPCRIAGTHVWGQGSPLSIRVDIPEPEVC